MKIAMIGQKRVPSREGGVEIVVEELSVRMVQHNHQVHLYNRLEDFSKENRKKLTREYEGVRIHQVPTFKASALNALVYSFFAAIRAVFHGYDIIHFHAEGPSVMLLIAKLFRVPTVVTIHGLDWQRAKWGGFATRYLLLGEKVAAKYADEVIVLSRGNQRYFDDTYGRKTVYIPNGVTLREKVAADLITKQYGLTKDSYILFLARIVPEKGLHYLIKAYKKVKTNKPLVIAGKIDKKNDYVQQICAMAKEDERIIMTDFVQGRMLEELFSNTFLYVLPSDIEGMPMSLLEAMNFGARCLVSNIEENRETTREYATFFERGNIELLRDKLESILESVQEHKEVEQINFVSRNYSWDSVTQATLELYERVIRKEDNQCTKSK